MATHIDDQPPLSELELVDLVLRRNALADLLEKTTAEIATRKDSATRNDSADGLVPFIWTPDTASGRRQSWARWVDSVDTAQRGAKAFDGDYLTDNNQFEVRPGRLFIEVFPCGSVKNCYQEAGLFRVGSNGEIEEITTTRWNWRSKFIEFRHLVASHI